MAEARYAPIAASLPDGKVLIAGGENRFFETTGTVELFNPASGAFESLPTEMRGRREEAASAPLRNGAVLIVGGFAEGALWLKTAERFNPTTNSFEELPAMTTERDLPATAALGNGNVLVAGGNNHNMTLTSAELFDAESDAFVPLAGELKELGGRSGAFATTLPDGQVLVAGGSNREAFLQSAELFDAPAGPFEAFPNLLSEARSEAAHVTLQDGELLAAGGRSTPAALSAEVFDPASASFTQIPAQLTTERDGAAAALLPSGEVLIVGGKNGSGNLKSAELAIPAAPSVATAPATEVSAAGATLGGSALSEALGSVYFQYGTSTAYGSSTPRQSLVASLAANPAAAAIGGLAPATTYHFRAVAENVGGVSYGFDQSFTTPARPRSTPVITAAKESASRWREGSKLAQISRRKLPIGSIFSFSLNEPAAVTFGFSRLLRGHEVRRRCVAANPRHGKHRACQRAVAAGVLMFDGRAGSNEIVFDGRISQKKKLKPGRYTLTITASNSAGRARPAKLGFTIVAK